MKKGLAILLTLTLMLGTQSACGGTTDPEGAHGGSGHHV